MKSSVITGDGVSLEVFDVWVMPVWSRELCSSMRRWRSETEGHSRKVSAGAPIARRVQGRDWVALLPLTGHLTSRPATECVWLVWAAVPLAKPSHLLPQGCFENKGHVWLPQSWGCWSNWPFLIHLVFPLGHVTDLREGPTGRGERGSWQKSV